jgi:hypothetical protein
MKRLILLIMLGLGILLGVGFKSSQDPAEAIAESEAGLLIFHKCKPKMEYEYLGTVKPSFVVPSKEFETILRILIKRAKEDYPNAAGLIVREWDADVIKWK